MGASGGASFRSAIRRRSGETFFDLDRIKLMAPKGESRTLPGSPVANEAMSRYADGDAAAFAILYDEIAARLEGFVRRRTRDPSRIDDIVQQTFERIHRARGTFIRGSDVLSWAFKIARNLCLDLGAQGWREQLAADRSDGTDPVAEAVAEVVSAERIAVARETLARLVVAFRRLPPSQQLALELVRVEGFTMAAAAENLGVTLPSLRMSVFRGGAALRASIVADEETEGSTRERPHPLHEELPHGVT
jgi:RNA polymerase sigma-70 factor (ECF subfamily)